MRYSDVYNPNKTPQGTKADGRQVANNAGGDTFELGDFERLSRFLVIGSEGGTYYVGQNKLTRDNAKVVERCAKQHAVKTVDTIRAISADGRAPSNSPAIFALAIVATVADEDGRRYALDSVADVCRTGTHLFEFTNLMKQYRGFSRVVRNGIGHWYTSKSPDKLAYQLVKYRQRDGWTHRDVMRLVHPSVEDPYASAVIRWAVKGELTSACPDVIHAFETLKHLPADKAAKFIADQRLTREMVPTELLSRKDVWDALLQDMPVTAMVRSLGKLSSIGLLDVMSDGEALVRSRLGDKLVLTKSRIHPMQVLTALKVYGQGRGDKGNLSWTPNGRVLDALDGAFYTSFKNVKPSGKKMLLALDVSCSMEARINSTSTLSCREAAAAMALVTANSEEHWGIIGFTGGDGNTSRPSWRHQLASGVDILGISPRARLDNVVRDMAKMPFGRTDCALPMKWAFENRIDADVFVIYTDNETWYGDIHPHQALKRYRDAFGTDAKLVVVGMTSTGFSIADPSDQGSLDVVGFDSATPGVISQFASGMG